MSYPLFEDVEVRLAGQDGNALSIVSRVKSALQRAGHREAASEFFSEALSGDYDHVLQTIMKYVRVG